MPWMMSVIQDSARDRRWWYEQVPQPLWLGSTSRGLSEPSEHVFHSRLSRVRIGGIAALLARRCSGPRMEKS